MRFLLVDCNNFFVSCERVFNPKLRNKPVVVLSSNDACIIARSNEAKALGIPMGAALFQWKDFIEKHNVIVYSANFPLYGDISSRVMATLTEFSAEIEIYSVDEAFLFISEKNPNFDLKNLDNYYLEYGKFLRKQVLKRTGIPISIGIGSTKTLAKVANRFAKKIAKFNGVFDITSRPDFDQLLQATEVGDIWGIGSRYAKLLNNKKNIKNTLDFKNTDSNWVKKNMTVMGLKTQLELRGQKCLNITECPDPKKSICVSRSFGEQVTSFYFVKESISTHISYAAEKLRIQKLIASRITIFITFSPWQESDRYYDSITIELPVPTAYTPDLIAAANLGLEKLNKPGFIYRSSGIILIDLLPENFNQLNFSVEPINFEKQENLMKIFDHINTKWGRQKLKLASCGFEQRWKMKQNKKSQCFTTSWHEILTIQI